MLKNLIIKFGLGHLSKNEFANFSHKIYAFCLFFSLGLERGNTAEEAMGVITYLLEKYGQGGPCSEHDKNLFYHNSFLIADPTVAWVLETSGNLWAAEKVIQYRNISNGLTITTKIDKKSEGLKEKAKELGLWSGQVRSFFLIAKIINK